MSRNEMYEIEKNIEKIIRGGSTNFIKPNYFKLICDRLSKDEYNVFYPYDDCDKVIIYTYDVPNVKLYEIISYDVLKHSEILGSLFGLNINDEMFGDIVIMGNRYFVYFMEDICNYVLDNFKMVGNKCISLKEVSLDVLSNYKREFDKIEVIVSSLRIDTVISRIIGISRDKAQKKVNNEEVLVNYNILGNYRYNLKDGDIFSIRGFGKYRFEGVIRTTKKDNYIINISKYV